MSGFVLQCLSGDADRLSVASSLNPSWVPVRRKWRCLPAKKYEVTLTRDEVVIVKSRGDAEIRLGGAVREEHGTLIVRSSRAAAFTLARNERRVLRLTDGEVVSLRTTEARDPVRGHSVHQRNV